MTINPEWEAWTVGIDRGGVCGCCGGSVQPMVIICYGESEGQGSKTSSW